jgi:hypothetical protein
VFYLVEAAAYSVFGISAFVAKGAVLGFVLLAALYMAVWLRYTVGPQLGWGGGLLLLQPGVIVWSHAVMLNVPAMALGLAALYHGRRLLDQPRSAHLYLVALFGVLAILTYLTTGVIVFVLLAWLLVERCGAIFRQPRTWLVAGLAALVLTPWAVITIKWAWAQYAMASGALYGNSVSFTGLEPWLSYLLGLPELFTIGLLALAASGAVVGLWSRRWRREALLALVWVLVFYITFSNITAREPRYILLVAPPLITLSMIALVWGADRVGGALAGNSTRATFAGLALIIGVHLVAAPNARVPATRGMREVVAFFEQEAQAERIFYDGKFDGIFSFYIRASDHNLTQSVTLGNKLLYVSAVDPRIRSVDLASSAQDVLDAFRERCGCKWLVVERKIEGNAPAPDRYLRQVIKGPEFQLVRSFPFEGPWPAPMQLDVYRFLLPIKNPPQQELRFPILGNDDVYQISPIGR